MIALSETYLNDFGIEGSFLLRSSETTPGALMKSLQCKLIATSISRRLLVISARGNAHPAEQDIAQRPHVHSCWRGTSQHDKWRLRQCLRAYRTSSFARCRISWSSLSGTTRSPSHPHTNQCCLHIASDPSVSNHTAVNRGADQTGATARCQHIIQSTLISC